jgi:hypothetical protein
LINFNNGDSPDPTLDLVAEQPHCESLYHYDLIDSFTSICSCLQYPNTSHTEQKSYHPYPQMDFSTTASALRGLTRRETAAQELRDLAAACGAGAFADDASLAASTADAEAAVRTFLASGAWEGVAVGFLLAKHMVTSAEVILSPDFVDLLFDQADTHLEHSEPRVRGLVASLLGSLARREGGGMTVYSRFCDRLSESISTNFERTHNTIPDKVSGDKEVAVDDTSGWKVGCMYLALSYVHHASVSQRTY